MRTHKTKKASRAWMQLFLYNIYHTIIFFERTSVSQRIFCTQCFEVMYMYYLLGYRLMGTPIDVDRKEIIAENTYILTLDGDIDFRPSAVKILVDLMKKNRDLGAACGRIHPIGSGKSETFTKSCARKKK